MRTNQQKTVFLDRDYEWSYVEQKYPHLLLLLPNEIQEAVQKKSGTLAYRLERLQTELCNKRILPNDPHTQSAHVQHITADPYTFAIIERAQRYVDTIDQQDIHDISQISTVLPYRLRQAAQIAS